MADNLTLEQLLHDGTPPEKRNVVTARCGSDDCGHEWIVAHLPMQLEKAAMLMQRAACPKCAHTRPLVGSHV